MNYDNLTLPLPSLQASDLNYSRAEAGQTDRKMIVMLSMPVGTKPLNIVIADDDADDRKLFAEALSYENKVKLKAMENGIQLMEHLHAHENLPDIIFLDLNMPGKSGKKCLEEIRNNKKLEHLPVVIYSTSSNRRDVDETYVMGANLYLRKPNTFKELKEATKRVVRLNWNDYKPKSQKKKFLFNSSAL